GRDSRCGRALHAGLLGARVQTGRPGASCEAQVRPSRCGRAPALAGRRMRSQCAGRRRARARFRDQLAGQGRRFRSRAGRVLVRRLQCADPRRDRARGRRLRPRVRHPRARGLEHLHAAAALSVRADPYPGRQLRERFVAERDPRGMRRMTSREYLRQRLLSRRQLNGLAMTGSWLGLAAAMLGAPARAAAVEAVTSTASTGARRTVKFRDGAVVSALGQGSAQLAQGRHPQAVEEEALRTSLSLGMTLIDTAELYGDGRSEEFIGRVIAGQRDSVFLVSKVWQSHATRRGIARACEASLARLGTDHLDLYLLHWPSGVTDLAGVVAAFENLRSQGKIRAWGVSNFKLKDMEAMLRI